MYNQVCTRPELALIVGVFGIYLGKSRMQHWILVKYVMCYLKRTRDFMLNYQKLDNLEIIGYLDSDFVGCLDSRHSTFGYIFLFAGGVVSWKSSKQTLVASSIMESNFVVSLWNQIMKFGYATLSWAYTLLETSKDLWRFIVTIVHICSTSITIWVLKNQSLLISSILWNKEFWRSNFW